jgi:hypothetical protein
MRTCSTICIVVCLIASLACADDIQHRFVATDESGKQLLYVDQFHPENDWTISVGKNRDIQVISDERLIISIPNGYREYEIKTGTLVKEVNHGKSVRSIVRMENGHTLLASGTTVWELDTQDEAVRKVDLAAGSFFRLLRLDTDGSYLFTGGPTHISKADRNGKILKTIDLKTIDAKSSKPYFALRLSNGNILISTGYGASLLELDATDSLVRKIGGRDSVPGTWLNFFGAADVLENGHIVVANWTGHKRDDSQKGPQLVEFGKQGEIVWTWHDPKRAGSIHGVCVIQ